MLIDEIRSLLRTNEFVPFTVHVTDGSMHHINHPDYAWLTPNNAVLYVFENNAGQRISVAKISRLELGEDAPIPT